MVRTVLSLAAVACLVAGQPRSLFAGQQPDGGASAAAKPPAFRTINLNTATVADLQDLPGIGAKTAERIIEYRQKNGPFKKIEDYMNVRGVGEKSFLRLKSQIVVSPPKPERGSPQ